MNDLQDRLDSAFGNGPAHRPLEPVLAAGRRAVRRRRVAAAGGVLAVLAIVGGTGVALAGGHPSATPPPLTQQPSVAPAPSETQEVTVVAAAPPWAKDEYARILPDGTVQIRPGAVVHDRVDDYLAGARRWDVSVALDISYRGDRQWLTVEHLANGEGGSSGYTEPNDGWADFRAWVADQSAAAGGGNLDFGDGYPGLVEADTDCGLTPVDPARVLAETTTALPPGFGRAAHVAQDGRRYLVLCRVVGGQPDVIKIHAEKHGDTLAELLDYARAKYASGEGVR